MNFRREELRKLHPQSTAIELTKIIGEEWTNMTEEKKKPYLAAAEIDRERYHQECISFKKKVYLGNHFAYVQYFINFLLSRKVKRTLWK